MSKTDNAHGGDITGYRLKYGKFPLDFSASLNPLGMPEAVKGAVIDGIENAYAYPDPFARELTTALAEKLGKSEEYLLIGNGAADLIYRYVQATRPKYALLPVPTFAEYERALRTVDCKLEYHYLEEENSFDMDESILPKITANIDILFLCQPGNPTGRIIDPVLLDKIMGKCRENNVLIFLDECFLSFVADGEIISKKDQIQKLPHLFILGSFTKLYGMAGIRLGYGLCSDSELLDKMKLNGQPWSVSTLAQLAGMAALGQDAYVKESLALIGREKQWLMEELKNRACFVIGASANYLFFRTGETELKEKLAINGILIRDCSNFRGLEPGYYRIAVRTRPENKQLIDAIDEVFEKEAAHGA